VPDKANTIRETDEEARLLARTLVEDARYAALAVNETGSGFPLVSRIAIACAAESGLFFVASDLSHHSKCLTDDARCSLLVGEVGRGDGLAHPRITMIGKAVRIKNSDPVRGGMREIFLTRHPKAKLYVDFADFNFYRLDCRRALLNGGFGRAYHLDRDDLEFANANAAG